MVWKSDGEDRLAKSLGALIDDIDQRCPDRDRHNDGTIGDAAHQARGSLSDHNPNVHLGGLGIVTALDVTHDPDHGFDAQAFAESLRKSRDKRIKYVIFNGQIFSSTESPWEWRSRGQGPGDHTEHVHISVVADRALYDDTSPWTYDVIGTPGSTVPRFPPKLQKGDTGPAVIDLQTLLGIEPDGIFGQGTETAVRAFQERNNLVVDGIVGSHTWGILSVSSPFKAPPPQDVRLAPDTIARITQEAARSALGGVRWDGSRAPIGYIKGMATVFGLVYAKWKARDSAALLMAAADSHREAIDVLSFYAATFRAAGMDNSVAGPDTLRHLFVLLFGLGMCESSGRYDEGRDENAHNVEADTAEAGLFQMSWNMRTSSAEMPRLFQLYSRGAESFLPIFQEGVTPRNSENYGTGEGAAYQRLCKSCPAFAVETTAVGVRMRRTHWGTINDGKVEIRPEADLLFRCVQDLMDLPGAVISAQAAPSPEDRPAQKDQPAPRPLEPIHALLLVIAGLLKERPMPDSLGGQNRTDPIGALLAATLQSIAGRQPTFGGSGGTAASSTPSGQIELSAATPPAGPAAPATTSQNADVLKQVTDVIQALEAVRAAGGLAHITPDQLAKIINLAVPLIQTTTAALGPVNGALGQWIGNLLNGRKSAIGIIGSLATGLIQAAHLDPTALAGPLAAVLPGLGQFGLPIFLAMTAWGFLGKMEKWTVAAGQTPPK
ncbi:peptidoglycan-binding domain-containing protein [Xanthobacter versatilis]|uniref:peptidoglycan-binding domain-containing protein n=1 Tax=Xanthobacter autotrophicus (strain ATCC BAA-1158 / Py2) TaxID=78245 RepID=UPI003727AAD1